MFHPVERHIAIYVYTRARGFSLRQRLPVFHGRGPTLQPSTVNAQFSRDASNQRQPLRFLCYVRTWSCYPSPGNQIKLSFPQRVNCDLYFHFIHLRGIIARLCLSRNENYKSEQKEKPWRTGSEKLLQFSTFCTVDFKPTTFKTIVTRRVHPE